MDTWKEYIFSDIIDINPKVDLPNDDTISFVSMKDLDESKKYCYPSIERYRRSGSKFVNGDILFAKISPCLENGKICQVKGLKNNIGIGSTELLVLRGKQGVSDTDFVYYLSRSQDVRSHAEMSLYGSSGRQRISVDCFDDLNIYVPPISEQKLVASILGCLDDKIDLLHRQNETLEKIAETLFRQWFIEEAQDDWSMLPLNSFGRIVCGKTPSKSNRTYYGGTIPFIKIPDMRGRTFVFYANDNLSQKGAKCQPIKSLPPKSILVSCIATVGLVAMNATTAHTNQQINSIILSNEAYRYYLYLYLRSLYDEFQALASGGTATLNLNTTDFSNIEILSPPFIYIELFNKAVTPIFDKIFNNQLQVNNLEKIRDTLLPRLISGDIIVK